MPADQHPERPPHRGPFPSPSAPRPPAQGEGVWVMCGSGSTMGQSVVDSVAVFDV